MGRWAVALGLLGVAAGEALRATTVIAVRTEDPALGAWQLTWTVLAVSVVVVGAGVGMLAAETWLRSTRMRRIAASLEAAPPPGTLATALARALADPRLRITYRLESGDLVDAGGRQAGAAGPGMVSTPVERDGTVLALVTHDADVDVADLAGTLSPTVLAALDHERLRAARLTRLAELRASRARIVAAADAERRRLERDLHDGVQQQLLTILFDLRLARLAAERAATPERASALAAAESMAQSAVDDLRRIAHGIHPAVLSRSGLGPALVSLSEEAPLPIDLEVRGLGRLPDGVEAAAYQVIAETVRDAAAGGAMGATIAAHESADRIVLTIEHDGPVRSEVPVRTLDRVGAAGGGATAAALPDGGTLLRVELPCA